MNTKCWVKIEIYILRLNILFFKRILNLSVGSLGKKEGLYQMNDIYIGYKASLTMCLKGYCTLGTSEAIKPKVVYMCNKIIESAHKT